MQLLNFSNGRVISKQVNLADNLITRMIGLIGRKGMQHDAALILKPCKQVHTFFMRFNIDIIFIDSRWTVKALIPDMPPCRISPFVRDARMVVELPGGTLKERVRPGDILALKE